PELAVILEPGTALDERPDREAIGAGRGRRLQREGEPCHLARADPRGRGDGDAVVTRPARVRTAELSIATELRRAVLSRLGIPRAKVRRVAHPAEHPPTRAAVVVADDPSQQAPGTERRVSALSIPHGVESRDTRWHRGWSIDPRSVRRRAWHRIRRQRDRPDLTREHRRACARTTGADAIGAGNEVDEAEPAPRVRRPRGLIRAGRRAVEVDSGID